MRHDQEHDADACAFCRERLPDYAAGYLQGDGRLFVERHLRTCARCSSELREWEAIKQVVRATDGMPQPRRAFADMWSELRAQLSSADIALDRSSNGRVLVEKMTSPGSDESQTRPDTSELPRTRLEEPAPRHRHSGKRFRGFAAAAAMAATVAALIAVLITLAPGHRPSPPIGGRTTSTATDNERGRWVDLTGLDYNAAFDANDVPAIAPTNPSVVYETAAVNVNGRQHIAATLRRTDDGGKTWHLLPLPVVADHVAHLGVAVSPLNARTVFLSVFDDNGGDCPANRAEPHPDLGIVFCRLQYTSVDGGQHWTAISLPLAGGTQAGILMANPNRGQLVELGVDAQGNKLYSGFMCLGWSCARLVTSTDGGLTWQFADEQIVAPGVSVCDYTTSAKGTTIFALTAKNCGDFRQTATQLSLWRSDDASAHWTRVSTLTAPSEHGLSLTTDAASGKQLLYTVQPRVVMTATDNMGGKIINYSSDPADLKVSTDGGKTWENSPSAGIPADLRAWYESGTLGTLHDGSIVVEFVNKLAETNIGGGTLFAWKRGDAKWHQIAPPLTQQIGSMLAIPAKDASQQDALYLVVFNRDLSGNTFKFLRYLP
ncbi:MAG TPA: zf-HC2 domain-containing protein [Ktedonobacterales bacterium]